ncbi:hypothetical protein [Flavobacterium sp.]|uniref:hypothetical protein n=1 Tax=Flavobacterium sp. TaxID=239 RepID=UPI003D0AE139
MQVTFQTKEESNRQQREAFLKLSGAERVFAFIELSKQINAFPTKHKPEKSNNFIIDFTKK